MTRREMNDISITNNNMNHIEYNNEYDTMIDHQQQQQQEQHDDRPTNNSSINTTTTTETTTTATTPITTTKTKTDSLMMIVENDDHNRHNTENNTESHISNNSESNIISNNNSNSKYSGNSNNNINNNNHNNHNNINNSINNNFNNNSIMNNTINNNLTATVISNNSNMIINSNHNNLTASKIPCCICGDMIYSNHANQCSNCLVTNYNLQERIRTDRDGKTQYITIYQCRDCRRYQRTDKHSESYELESTELLNLCLKHVPALQNQMNHDHNNNKNDTIQTSPLKVIDSKWIWTEPHCMRLKIYVTIQTEIYNVPIQQRCLIPFHIQFKQCYDCSLEYKSRTWNALIQIRQKYDYGKISNTNPNTNKNGLHYIEYAIKNAKPIIRKYILKMDHVKCGYDFYFMNVNDGYSFISFIQSIYPMKIKYSQKLISTDSKNNTAHMKHTITADLISIQKYDIIVIHKSTPKNIYAGKLALVYSMSNNIIHLQDINLSYNASLATNHNSSNNNKNNNNKTNRRKQQHHQQYSHKGNVNTNHNKNDDDDNNNKDDDDNNTLNSSMNMNKQHHYDCNRIELSVDAYYKYEKNYKVLLSSNHLIRFIVLDIELLVSSSTSSSSQHQHHHIDSNDDNNNKGQEYNKNYYVLADVIVARENDMGINNNTYHVRTHLGHIIHVGDIVLGYDLLSSTLMTSILNDHYEQHNDNNNNTSYIKSKHYNCPDIVLIKKYIPSKKEQYNMKLQYDDDTIYNNTNHNSSYTRSKQHEKQRHDNNNSDMNHGDDHSPIHHDNDQRTDDENHDKEDINVDDPSSAIFTDVRHHIIIDDDNNDIIDQQSIMSNNNQNTITTIQHTSNDDVDDDDNNDIMNQKHLSKKKLRRRVRQQGKRKKALEESAIRMGLIQSTATTTTDHPPRAITIEEEDYDEYD